MRLINADELKEILIGKRLVLKCIGGNKYALMAFDYCIRRIDEVQTIEAVPVHGEWIESKCLDECFWVCSKCRFPSQALAAPTLYHFCPNCGAKMDGKAV